MDAWPPKQRPHFPASPVKVITWLLLVNGMWAEMTHPTSESHSGKEGAFPSLLTFCPPSGLEVKGPRPAAFEARMGTPVEVGKASLPPLITDFQRNK